MSDSFSTFPQAPFQLTRQPDEWDDVSARARLFATTFPQLAMDPNALWSVATAPIPPITAAQDAYSLVGAQSTSLNIETVKGWSESVQRSWFAGLAPAEKAKWQAMGYEVPHVGNDPWGMSVVKHFGPLFEGAYKAGYTGVTAVGRPLLRGISEVGELPFEAIGEVRTGEPWQQVLAGVVATGATLYLMKGGLGPGSGAFGAAVSSPAAGGLLSGAGGASFQQALAFQGGAGLSLTAATFATTAWATKAVTDSIMGNHETWMEPIGWLDHKKASERNFVHGAMESATKKLEGENGMVLDFARELALEADDPVEQVLTEFAGEQFPAEKSLEQRRAVMLNALERMVLARFVPGSQAFQDAYAAGEAMITDERFADAVDTLIAGKVSVGRDVVRLLSLPLGHQADLDSGLGKLISGAVDATSWMLVDPVIGAAKFGHASRIMRRALMVDAAELPARIANLVERPGTRAAFRVIATHLNAADADATALSRLLRAMPDSAELLEPMKAWRAKQELRQVARGLETGSWWTEDRIAEFFTDHAGLAQMIAGKAGSYRYGFLQMPYLNPYFGEKTAMLKTNFWKAIESGDDIHLGIHTKTFDSPLYRAAERLGILPGDPNRVWGSPGVLVERSVDEAGNEVPRLVRIFGVPMSITKSLLTRTPTDRAVSLALHAGGSREYVKELRSLTELMREVGVPSHVRQTWFNLIVSAPDVGARRQAVRFMYDTVFESVAIKESENGRKFADKFIKHLDEVYTGGRKDATFVAETANMIAIPSLVEMRKALVAEHLYNKILGVSDANVIDATMNRFWKPAVIMRMGFVTRAVGDELLGWIAREGAAGYVQARMAKFFASDDAMPGHVRWLESSASLTHDRLADLYRRAAFPWRDAEDLADFGLMGDEIIRLGFLKRYGDWMRRFSENGTWMRRINPPGAQMSAWLKRPGSFRAMLFNGVEDDVLRYSGDFWSDRRIRAAIMKETAAVKGAGITGSQAERLRNPATESPLEASIYDDAATVHLIGSGRGGQAKVADSNNPSFYDAMMRDQGQILMVDDPINHFLDVEVAAPTDEVRQGLSHVFPNLDPKIDLEDFSGTLAETLSGIQTRMADLDQHQKILLSHLLVQSDSSPAALRKWADEVGGDDAKTYRMVADVLQGDPDRAMLLTDLIDAGMLPAWTGRLGNLFSIPQREVQLTMRSYFRTMLNRAGKGRPIEFRLLSSEERRRALVETWVRHYGSNPDWRQRTEALSMMNQTSRTGRPLAYNPGPGETMGYVPLVPVSVMDPNLASPRMGPDELVNSLTAADVGYPVLVNGQPHYPVIGMVTFDPTHAQRVSERLYRGMGIDATGNLRPGQITAEVVLPSSVGGGRSHDVDWFSARPGLDPERYDVASGIYSITNPQAAVVHVPDPAAGRVMVQMPDGSWTMREGASVEEAILEHADVTVDGYMEKFYTSSEELRDPDHVADPGPKHDPIDPEMEPLDPGVLAGVTGTPEGVEPPTYADGMPVQSYLDPVSGRYDLTVNPDGVIDDINAGFPFAQGQVTVEVTDPKVPHYPDQMSHNGPVFQWQSDPTGVHPRIAPLVPESAVELPHEYVQSLAMHYVPMNEDGTARTAEQLADTNAEVRRILDMTRRWSPEQWADAEAAVPDLRLQVEQVRAFVRKPDVSMGRVAELYGERTRMADVLTAVLGNEGARRAGSLNTKAARAWADAQWDAAPNRFHPDLDAVSVTDPVARAAQDLRQRLYQPDRHGDVWVRASEWDAAGFEGTRDSLQARRQGRGVDPFAPAEPEATNIVLLVDDVKAARSILRRLEADPGAADLYQQMRVVAHNNMRPALFDVTVPPYRPESFHRIDDPTTDALGYATALHGPSGDLEPGVMVKPTSGATWHGWQRMAEAAGTDVDTWAGENGMLAWFMANYGMPPSRFLELVDTMPKDWRHTYIHETGHQLFGHVLGSPISSGQERAVHTYAMQRVGLPGGNATWGVAGTHPHPESAMLGAWLNGRMDKEAILAHFRQQPKSYYDFLDAWAKRNVRDPLTDYGPQAFDFDDVLAQVGYRRPPGVKESEGPHRLMFESVGLLTGESMHHTMRDVALGGVPVLMNTFPREKLPGRIIERAPLAIASKPRGFDRVVNYSFSEVMGPMMDNLLREPMAFHHYVRARRDADAALRWMLDPYYWARDVKGGWVLSTNHVNTVPYDELGERERALVTRLQTDGGLVNEGGFPAPFARGGQPVLDDPVVDKALEISLGRRWMQDDRMAEPWLAANREKVLEALGDDPAYEPLRNIVHSIVTDSTYADVPTLAPRGRVYDLAEGRVAPLDLQGLRQRWQKVRPALKRLETSTLTFSARFNIQDLVVAARNRERTLALIQDEIRGASSSLAMAERRSSKAGVATAQADLDGLHELHAIIGEIGFMDADSGAETMLDWWASDGRRRLHGKDLFRMTPEQATEALARINRTSPFGDLTLGELEVLEGAHVNRENVTRHTKELAIHRAINDTVPYVDRDNIRTQFSDKVRNLIPFWAAEEQFMRRWARIAVHTPEFIRKAQLTYMGLKHAGFVQTDEFGNDYFVYPGSTALVEAMSQLPFLQTMAPVATAFTGQVRFSLPGLDRFGVPQVSPLASIPMQQIANVVPELKPISRALSGDRAADLSVWEQLIPTQITRFAVALSQDPLHSERMANSFATAAAVMQANGQGMPDSADPTQVQDYINRLRNHTRTVYLAKAIFGFFAPASPQDQILGDRGASTLDAEGNVVPVTGKPDAWSSFSALTGVSAPNVLLGDEYFDLVSNLGIEEGTFEFLRLFPDSTPEDLFNRNIVYRTSRSETLGKAPIVASDDSLDFYYSNEQWIRDNPLAGAWLMPPTSRKKVSNTESQRARAEQMASGLRARKDLTEFVRELQTAAPSDYYFTQKRWFEDQMATMTDQDQVRAMRSRQATWEASFKAANPIFAADLQNSEGRVRRQAVLAAMRVASRDPETPDARHKAALFELVQSYDIFRGIIAQLSMLQTDQARLTKEAVKKFYQDWGDQMALRDPDVARFWSTIITPEAELD